MAPKQLKINLERYRGFTEPGAVSIMKQLEMMHETQREILAELQKTNKPQGIGIVLGKKESIMDTFKSGLKDVVDDAKPEDKGKKKGGVKK